ncbi:MAG: DUF1616 domain-containing protein [Candidatus Thermoplasmatota archaeon]|nr:DUF1616 domain-containing protein [Candidatus Thermoplasmatota archaeon]MBU1941873.1 DUF1616 domain-containing protein [Candidatus Thermoplasmatota archaeon]
MRITFTTFPYDILICILWSIILLPTALLNLDQTLRIILGLPFILFIPGYLLIFALFPTKKTTHGIDGIERIALSFGLSIAIVPLIGLGLNYTPWGIRLEPILLSLFLFIILMALIALYRWYTTPAKDRFSIDLNIEFPKDQKPFDKALTIILAITIIAAGGSLIYVIVTPRIGEQFTEFYYLSTDHLAHNFPRNLTLGQNATIILGIVNHEYRMINYTIEIWLVNQTTLFNESTNETTVQYHQMWYLDSIQTQLNHTPIDIEGPWQPQWETNYTFTINRIGTFKLAFLLYIDEENVYDPNTDIAPDPEEKLTSAYRDIHLWLTITE